MKIRDEFKMPLEYGISPNKILNQSITNIRIFNEQVEEISKNQYADIGDIVSNATYSELYNFMSPLMQTAKSISTTTQYSQVCKIVESIVERVRNEESTNISEILGKVNGLCEILAGKIPLIGDIELCQKEYDFMMVKVMELRYALHGIEEKVIYISPGDVEDVKSSVPLNEAVERRIVSIHQGLINRIVRDIGNIDNVHLQLKSVGDATDVKSVILKNGKALFNIKLDDEPSRYQEKIEYGKLSDKIVNILKSNDFRVQVDGGKSLVTYTSSRFNKIKILLNTTSVPISFGIKYEFPEAEPEKKEDSVPKQKTITESSSIDGDQIDIFDTIMTQSDTIKLIGYLPLLRDYLWSIKNNLSTKTCDAFKLMLCNIYNNFIVNVSALRRYSDTLPTYYNIIKSLEPSDSDQSVLKDKLIGDINDMIETVNKRLEATKIGTAHVEYDVLVEMGMEYLYDEYGDDDTLHEGAIKEKVVETARKGVYEQKKAFKNIDSIVDRVVDDFRNAKKEETEASLVKSTFKASSILKKIIASIGLAGVGVAFGYPAGTLPLLYLITSFAINKKNSEKNRRRLLIDMEEELKIVQEKIRDADRADDKEAKYKLMRLESQLTKSMQKVRYHLNSY